VLDGVAAGNQNVRVGERGATVAGRDLIFRSSTRRGEAECHRRGYNLRGKSSSEELMGGEMGADDLDGDRFAEETLESQLRDEGTAERRTADAASYDK